MYTKIKNQNFLSEKIKTLTSVLKYVQGECNKNPFNVKKIEKELSRVCFEKNDLFLANDLPGPLAKLFLCFKRHQNKEDLFEKFDFAEHFFMTLLFFNISIIFGAIQSNYGFYVSQKDRIKKSMQNPDSIGFGDLLNLSKTLSKVVREKLANKKGEDFLKSLFKISDLSFVKGISNLEIYKIIEDFSYLRNEMKGHGGRISNETYEEIMPKVERILYSALDLLDYFDKISLILGSNFKKQGNSFLGEVTFIKGYATPYLVENRSLPVILDENVIYYIDNCLNVPVMIYPFVKPVLGKDEGEISFYFYNRVEGNKIRYVNYDLLDGDKYYSKKDIDTDLMLR